MNDILRIYVYMELTETEEEMCRVQGSLTSLAYHDHRVCALIIKSSGKPMIAIVPFCAAPPSQS